MLNATGLRPDLVGFSELSSGRRFSLAEAEQRFGACIYRQGERPRHLVPVFTPGHTNHAPDNRAMHNLGDGNRWVQAKETA